MSSPRGFRFFVQPSVALFFAIRDGLADARHGGPPYLIPVFLDSGDRVKSLKTALHSAGKVFAIAAPHAHDDIDALAGTDQLHVTGAVPRRDLD